MTEGVTRVQKMERVPPGAFVVEVGLRFECEFGDKKPGNHTLDAWDMFEPGIECTDGRA